MSTWDSEQAGLLGMNSFYSLTFSHKEFSYQVVKCLSSHGLLAWESKKSVKKVKIKSKHNSDLESHSLL